MSMTEMQIGDQTIRYDRDATAAVYGTKEHGFAEGCGCIFCKNFAVQRNLVYPASFRALLEQLGIDSNKEGEAFQCMPVEDGCQLYGGWFYLLGELITAGEQNTNAADSHQFEYFFRRADSNVPAFHGPTLALEFTAHVKWVLPEPAPDRGQR
jgi:hypothetical protein